MTNEKTTNPIQQLDSWKVGQVKDYLASSNVTEDILSELRLDQRKGVQAALKKYDKGLAAQLIIQEKIHELRALEQALHQKGYQFIAGVDEVGRGPLAGPVVTSAVILPSDMPAVYFNDSKQLSHAKRKALVMDIEKYAISYSIGLQTAEQIDESNILIATKQAMIDALNQLSPQPDYVLIDAVKLDQYHQAPQEAIIKGDASVYAIAAASIYAKEYRDNLMATYGQKYPEYGFAENAGYGTKRHLEALEAYGPTPIHRKTFAPVKKYL